MDRSFKGAAKRIDDIDLPRLGKKMGVGEDEIHAFIEAETSSSGFDAKGRPKMLFEPHVFYRNLSGAKRSQAVKHGLAYKSWGQKPYPKDSYPRLLRAMDIDETAALKSASWGLGQVLGENHIAAGFNAPQAMVKAMMEDEETHLEASVNFIIYNRLDDELRDHDWSAFARGYNGPGYKKNGYHTKLADAYAKWARIKDTPLPYESYPDIASSEVTGPATTAKPAGGTHAVPVAVGLGSLAVLFTAAWGWISETACELIGVLCQ